MDTEYLDDEQVIALYNKVRTGRRTWPAGIWSSPAALQYAVTVFDYWIHNVMGWKSWVDARGRINPVLLEQHRLADIVDNVFVPEFGEDWLDFEVVLNESMRLSDDPDWGGDASDRQERVEAAFEHAYEQLIGSPKSPDQLGRYHRFRNHLLPGALAPRPTGGCAIAGGAQLLVEDDQAVGMGVAPEHRDLADALLLGVDDGPALGRAAARRAHQAEPAPDAVGGLPLGLVVLGLRLLVGAPHAEQVVAEVVVAAELVG